VIRDEGDGDEADGIKEMEARGKIRNNQLSLQVRFIWKKNRR